MLASPPHQRDLGTTQHLISLSGGIMTRFRHLVLAIVLLSSCLVGDVRAVTFERTESTERPPSPPGEETHIAIAMGGAVSLGAFEAGVLAELTHQLTAYNARHQNHKYVIDVLAGASAGSMSLAILTNELYASRFDPTDCSYPDSSVFYKAWVQGVGIQELVNIEARPRLQDDPYIFDPDIIYRVAREALSTTLEAPARGSSPDPPSGGSVPPGQRGTPLSIAPEELLLGMTLSSMEGQTRKIELSNGTLDHSIFQDLRTFRLTKSGRDLQLLLPEGAVGTQEVSWDELARTAIASGAFPLAFPPVRLTRYRKEYDPTPDEFGDSIDEAPFTYVDGGFFDNDPLHLAENLARRLDSENPPDGSLAVPVYLPSVQSVQLSFLSDSDAVQSSTRILSPDYQPIRDRRFIYLAPGVPRSDLEAQQVAIPMGTSKSSTGQASTSPAYADTLHLYAKRILEMGLGTARGQGFHAYVREHDQNQRGIRNLASEIQSLADTIMVEDGELILRSLAFMGKSKVHSGDIDLLRKFAAYARADVDSVSFEYWPRLNDEVKRRVGKLDNEKGSACEWLTASEAGADSVWKQLFVQLFEVRGLNIANNFILISTERELEVVGGKFNAFGGFFDEELRDFDFLLGRFYAQQSLVNDLNVRLSSPCDSIKKCDVQKRRDSLRSLDTLADHFPTLEERQAFRKDAETRLAAYIDHAQTPRIMSGLAFSAGNRWLNSTIYHEPRYWLARGLVGYDEFHSLGVGTGFDVRRILGWIPCLSETGIGASAASYDDLFRKPGRRAWAQLFVMGEYGYWGQRDRHYFDFGAEFQLHWRASAWIAPRFTLELGQRRPWERLNNMEGSIGWYNGLGVEFSVVYLGIRSERSPTWDSPPTTVVRAGLSVIPTTTWKTVRAFF